MCRESGLGTAETLEPQGFEPGLWAARFLCPRFFFRVCVFPPADNFNLALILQDYTCLCFGSFCFEPGDD
jgi:hypothetical protein